MKQNFFTTRLLSIMFPLGFLVSMQTTDLPIASIFAPQVQTKIQNQIHCSESEQNQKNIRVPQVLGVQSPELTHTIDTISAVFSFATPSAEIQLQTNSFLAVPIAGDSAQLELKSVKAENTVAHQNHDTTKPESQEDLQQTEQTTSGPTTHDTTNSVQKTQPNTDGAQPQIAPTTPAPIPAPADLDPLFEKYGTEFGVSSTVLRSIARCESSFNPNVLSKNGLYGGLYQYSTATWISTRKAMGLDQNPELRFNAEEAIRTSAFKIAHGGIGAWPTCGKRALGN